MRAHACRRLSLFGTYFVCAAFFLFFQFNSSQKIRRFQCPFVNLACKRHHTRFCALLCLNEKKPSHAIEEKKSPTFPKLSFDVNYSFFSLLQRLKIEFTLRNKLNCTNKKRFSLTFYAERKFFSVFALDLNCVRSQRMMYQIVVWFALK